MAKTSTAVKPKTNSSVSKKNPETMTVSTKPKPAVKRPWLFIGLGVILVLAILGYVFKNQFIVVVVNGKPITRAEYIKTLETQGGKQVLNRMITERLVMAEAQKQNLTVPQTVIDSEITKIEGNIKAQGMTLDQALAEQNMTLADLQKQIMIRQLVTDLTASQAAVTDADVQKYLTDNKDKLPTGKNAPKDIETLVRQQLEQTKQQTVADAWLKELQSQANIQYW
jgi:hypothetical protein